jgi:transcriptional regulator with XRE-family HTH domain
MAGSGTELEAQRERNDGASLGVSPRLRAAASPQPLRPRGGFGGYLHELRRERGFTIRQLAAAAGVHHTYVSKLERGDRLAPEQTVVEALAAALGATPAQLDQLRWRAGLAPLGEGAPGSDDPTLTLVAEALGDLGLIASARDQLRQGIVQLVEGVREGASNDTMPRGRAAPARAQHTSGAQFAAGTSAGFAAPPGYTGQASIPPSAPVAASSPAFSGVSVPPVMPALSPGIAPEAPPDGRASILAAMVGGWQTVDEAAAELRVTPAYLLSLVQSRQLRAWALPGAPPGSTVGLRLRREDVMALLQPVQG